MLDVLIRRGSVVDSTGGPAHTADAAVQGGKIVEVGDLPGAEAQLVIDASGKVVAPGFIDLHTPQRALRHPRRLRGPLRALPETGHHHQCRLQLRVVGGPLASGQFAALPLHPAFHGVSSCFEPEWETQKEFHDWLAARRLPMNFVPLSAHGPIRIAVMGDNARFCIKESPRRKRRLAVFTCTG